MSGINRLVKTISQKNHFTKREVRKLRKYLTNFLKGFKDPEDFFYWLETQPETEEINVLKRELNTHFKYKSAVTGDNFVMTHIKDGSTNHGRYHRWLCSTLSPYRLFHMVIYGRWFSGTLKRSRTKAVVDFMLRRFGHRTLQKDEVEQMDVLRTFTFKGDRYEGPSATAEKRQFLSSVNANARRVMKKETRAKKKRNWSAFKGIIESKTGVFLPDARDEPVRFKKALTKCFRILDTKRYDTLNHLLESNKPEDKAVLDDLADKFLISLWTNK